GKKASGKQPNSIKPDVVRTRWNIAKHLSRGSAWDVNVKVAVVARKGNVVRKGDTGNSGVGLKRFGKASCAGGCGRNVPVYNDNSVLLEAEVKPMGKGHLNKHHQCRDAQPNGNRKLQNYERGANHA